MFSRSVKFDEESMICGQVGRSETSSLKGASCDIFQHLTTTREKEIDTTGCRLQKKTLKQHIDASMGKDVDSTRDLEEEKKCCRKSDEEPHYTIKTRNRTHQENQVNPLPSNSEKNLQQAWASTIKPRHTINKFIMETRYLKMQSGRRRRSYLDELE